MLFRSKSCPFFHEGFLMCPYKGKMMPIFRDRFLMCSLGQNYAHFLMRGLCVLKGAFHVLKPNCSHMFGAKLCPFFREGSLMGQSYAHFFVRVPLCAHTCPSSL